MESNPVFIFAAFLLTNEPNDLSKPPPMYRMNEPIEGRPNTKISQLLLVNSGVEVFARLLDDPSNGVHVTLSAPTVTTVVSAGPRALLDAFLADMSADEQEKVVAARDIYGNEWRLNAHVPTDPFITIVKMVHTDVGVEIVALPDPGSPMEANNMFLVYTLLPLSYVSVSAEATLSNWQAIQQEMALPDEEDEEEEEEEIETTVVSTTGIMPPAIIQQPPPPPPLPTSNGASTPTTTE